MASNKTGASPRRNFNLWPALALATLMAGCLPSPTPARMTFKIGNTIVLAPTTQHQSPAPTFINVHDDENTSVLAGATVIMESSGRLIELAHSGKRLVSFEQAGQTYRFDPNRIFSPVGIRATLERTGNYSAAAQHAVEEFAARFLETFALDREPVIIALHNTGGGGLSINSYLPTGDKPTTASAVHVSTNRFAGDFFYVTDRRFFDYLQARDFNVTLQDDANIPDDGSASIYFARKGIPYVNVEADHHHLAEQIEMVRVARGMMVSLGLVPNP